MSRCFLMVAAEAREFGGLLRHVGDLQKLTWPVDYARSAVLRENRVLLVANGPGPKLAAQAVDVVRGNETVDLIVSTGLCGALAPNLALCEIVVATSVVDPRAGKSYVAEPVRSDAPSTAGAVVSIDRIAGTVGEKTELHRTGAVAVEMEAAGVAVRTAVAGLPFYCVKVVSDRADEGFVFDFNQARDEDGRFATGKIVRAALRRPVALIPELLRLEKRSRAAAEALGDFLAECRF